MAWNPDNADKPLTLVQERTVAEVMGRTGYKPAEKAEPMLEESLSPGEFLKRLAEAECYEDAIQFLAFAMHCRGGVWWAYQCVKMTQEEIDAAPPAEPAEKPASPPSSGGEPGGSAPAAGAKGAPPTAGADVGEAANEAAAPGLRIPEPRLSQPVGPLQRVRARLREEMGPQKAAEYDAERARIDAMVRRGTGKSLRELVFAALAVKMGKKPAASEPPAAVSPPAPEAEPEAAAVPAAPPPAPALGALGEQEQSALARARAWVVDPTEANGQAAYRAAEKLDEAPAGFVAKSAFWSGANIAPDSPTVVPPPPGLAPQAIFVGILLSSNAQGGAKSPPQRQQEYLELGLAVARGENTWEQPSAETAGVADPWAGRAGFGRNTEHTQ